jgi:hypothetical protein
MPAAPVLTHSQLKDDLAKFTREEEARKAEKARLQKEAVDLKAKEAQLLKEKTEKEAALAAAKAKQDADRKAKEKAVADAKAANALQVARNAQVAADAAAYAATPSGPAKDAIMKRINEETKKAKDAAQAITDAQKKVDEASAQLAKNEKLINSLTDALPKIGPNIKDIRDRAAIDVEKLKQESIYSRGLLASIVRLNKEPRVMPKFEDLKKTTAFMSTRISTSVDFRDFSKSFVQQQFGFSTRFGMTLTGFIDIPFSSQWHIFIESDDGSRVFVDGSLLVDNDGLHGMEEKKGSKYLTKGKHQLLIEFSQWDWGGGLVMRWMNSIDNKKEIVPSTAFYTLSPNAPAPIAQEVRLINKDVLNILPMQQMTGGSGGRRPVAPVTVVPQQKVDDMALIVAQKAKELQKEKDRLAQLARDEQAAKDAREKAAAATAQAAAAKKIADEMAKEEQRKKDEAARARIAADSKRIDDLKKAEAAAAVKLAAEKAAQELAAARFQQESKYAAAVAQRSAFYSEVADYAANAGSVISGVSIGGAADMSPLQCVRACNSNPACVAFSTTVQYAVVPGLAVTYYKAKLSQLPSNWNGMNIAKEAVVPNINFPSGSVQGNSGMTVNFAAVYSGFVSVPKAGQWVFYITSDDGSKL